MAGSDATEAELFARLGRGWDAEALGVLYDRHANRFLAVLRRRGFSQPDAEDILQNCFVRLSAAGRTLERVQNPRAYLWRMLFNASSDLLAANRLLREADPYNPGDSESFALESAASSPEVTEASMDIDACVDRAWSLLQQTAPERAQALEWAVIDCLSGEEISELLGRTYGATREYLSQCRRVLRELVLQVCPDWKKD